MSDQPSHKLGLIVSAVGLLAIGATIVARFNTLENANDLRVNQVTELKQRCDALETRMLSLERNSEIRDRIGELRSDVAVLNEKVDALSRRRGQ